MQVLKVVKANESDCHELTALTKKSKAIWGFNREQLEDWEEELTITKEYINKNKVYILLKFNEIIGYYSYLPLNRKIINLDNLFIHQDHIRKGYGKMLLQDLFTRLKDTSFEKISLDSEPKAEGFYTKFSFKVVGKQESSIPGRFLIIMEKKI